jgi:hypothetical protein
MVPMMVVALLQYSQHWQAADLFRAAPLAGPAPLCHGVRKAVLLLLTLPLVLTLSACVLLIEQHAAALVMMIPGIMVLPVVALIPNLGGRAIPLSQPIEEAKSAGRGLTMMGAIIATMALSGIAMLAWTGGWLWLLLIIEFVIVTALYVLLRHRINRAGWPTID